MRRGLCKPRRRKFRATGSAIDFIERTSVSRNLRREMGMHNAQIIALVRPILEAVAEQDRSLAKQLSRALSSVALNIAEAGGCTAGHRRHRFETARGSLHETAAALRVASAWGHVSLESTQAPVAALDPVAGGPGSRRAGAPSSCRSHVQLLQQPART
jgi:four helix bundle protein